MTVVQAVHASNLPARQCYTKRMRVSPPPGVHHKVSHPQQHSPTKGRIMLMVKMNMNITIVVIRNILSIISNYSNCNFDAVRVAWCQ